MNDETREVLEKLWHDVVRNTSSLEPNLTETMRAIDIELSDFLVNTVDVTTGENFMYCMGHLVSVLER